MATEKELILDMQTILIEKMEKDYQKGNIKRDAHPKCLGLLKADFKIIDTLPPELKVGIFKSPKTYKSWIRISNASGRIQSDKKKDFRGFAIKLLGIEGERLTTDETHTQDFLLMSFPTMPLGTVQLFRDTVYYSIKWNPFVLLLKFILSGNQKILSILSKGKKNDTSPLDINYWSTTPYQFGKTKVKYKIIPTSSYKSVLPNKLSDNYLTSNMDKHLKQGIATFDFYIQQYKDEASTPIENAGIEWKEDVSPFIKVAEIKIPTQEIDTSERFKLAEIFSFSPANTLKELQPLGGINRARIAIYKAISKFRHKQNNVALIEPSINDYEATK